MLDAHRTTDDTVILNDKIAWRMQRLRARSGHQRPLPVAGR